MERAEGVVAVLKTFRFTRADGLGGSCEVDIVACGGAKWIKVKSLSSANLERGVLEGQRHGVRTILHQAKVRPPFFLRRGPCSLLFLPPRQLSSFIHTQTHKQTNT